MELPAVATIVSLNVPCILLPSGEVLRLGTIEGNFTTLKPYLSPWNGPVIVTPAVTNG